MRSSWLVVVGGVVAGCGSSGGVVSSKAPVQADESCAYPPCDTASETSTPSDAGACHYPATVAVDDGGSAPGCFAGPPGQACEVSIGATVLQDGAVANGTETCTSLCRPGEFELGCHGGQASSSPDAMLNCRVIPVPTPPGALFYCCPCAP